MSTLRIGHPNEQRYVFIDDATLQPAAPSVTSGLVNVADWQWDTVNLIWAKAPLQSSSGVFPPGSVVPGDPIATASRQDVLITLLQQVANAILNCDTSNVTVSQGTIAISNLPLVQPISAAIPIPVVPQGLAPNQSQESGGNLDQITANLVAMNQRLDNLFNMMQTQLGTLTAVLTGGNPSQTQ